MATKINQKEYLKKYLSNDVDASTKDATKKKKKKKSKPAVANVRIIDDDVDISRLKRFNDAEMEAFAIGEEVPQIVGVVDDRPAEMIASEDYKQSEKWRMLRTVDGSLAIGQLGSSRKAVLPDDEGPAEQRRFTRYVSDDEADAALHEAGKASRRKVQAAAARQKKKRSASPSRARRVQRSSTSPQAESRRAATPDVSPPRRRIKTEPRDSSRSPEGASRSKDSSPPRRRRSPSADESLSRRKRGNSDASPPRRRHHDSDGSPPRRKRRESDVSPPRRYRQDSDASPPRRKRRDSDASPPRRNRRDSDASPPRRKRRDSDASPPRRNRRDSDASPPRRKRQDSEASPPRRNRRDSDASPTRRRHRDPSPPRRAIKKEATDKSPTRRGRRDSDASPPRRNRQRSRSPAGGSGNHHQRQPESSRSAPSTSAMKSEKPSGRTAKMSRWSRDRSQRPSPSPPPTNAKMARTLDGKAAGLLSAEAMRTESSKFRTREAAVFDEMSAAVSGRDAEAVVRDRRTGRVRDVEAEMAVEHEKMRKELERKAVYDRWGKGVKQLEEHQHKRADEQHEASKPLARYADDSDRDALLRERDREDDPMLEYLRNKQTAAAAGQPARPVYRGSFAPNRFGIRPGYRWDGVDRSNGFEKRWFDVQSKSKAAEEETYKYMTEDM